MQTFGTYSIEDLKQVGWWGTNDVCDLLPDSSLSVQTTVMYYWNVYGPYQERLFSHTCKSSSVLTWFFGLEPYMQGAQYATFGLTLNWDGFYPISLECH
jgi:hypothetical protein